MGVRAKSSRTARPLRSSLTVAVLLLCFGCTAAPDAAVEARVVAACEAELRRVHQEGRFPGATATVVVPSGAVIPLAVGTTEAGGRPLTPRDRMLVGSAGKTWVAAVVQMLQAKGQLTLDDKVSRWFSEADWCSRVPNGEDLTVRHLLRHQSGLPRYVFKPGLWRALLQDPDRRWLPRELLEFVMGDDPLFPAGTGWAYADTNYILLGMIIEAVTGRAYYDLAAEWINGPLGLTDTIPSNSRVVPGVVQGTVELGKRLGVGDRALKNGRFTYNVQFEWCGGGFASTATDLARWAHIRFSDRLMGARAVKDMSNTVPAPALGSGVNYGLGVMIHGSPLGTMYRHDGFMPGFLTTMAYFPDHDMAVAIQVNTDAEQHLGMRLSDLATSLAQVAQRQLRATARDRDAAR